MNKSIFFVLIIFLSTTGWGIVIDLDVPISPSNSNASYIYSNQTGLTGIQIHNDRIVSESNDANITSIKNPATPTNYTVYRNNLSSKEINTLNRIQNWSLDTNYENISTNLYSILFFIAGGTYSWDWYNDDFYYNITDISFSFDKHNNSLNILNLYARNISFFDNRSSSTMLYPTCIQNGYSYTYEYHMPKGTNIVNCSLFGYDDISFTPISTYIDNSTYEMEPASVSLTFTENTSGFIKTPNEIESFTNVTAISLFQRNLSEGRTIIEFNPDENGNYQQIFAFENNHNGTISEELLVETVDLQQKIKITGDTQAIENARVCSKGGYTDSNITDWMTTYCDFTDSTGEVIIKVNDGETYLFCAQADGYEATCELIPVPETNQDTITINLVGTDSNKGMNTFKNSCQGIFQENTSCSLIVATYKPYSEICLNVTKYNGSYESTVVCKSDSIAEIFSYSLLTTYNYTIGVYLDNELSKTFLHTYGYDDSENKINFESGNNSGYTIRDRIIENKPLFVFVHFIIVVLGVLAGYMFDKYFNGYGVYGAGIWFLFVSLGGFYVFFIPTIIITVYFITEKVIPLFQN